MNLLKKTLAAIFFSGLAGSAACSQEMTAVETAEFGVQTLLQTVVESKESSERQGALFQCDRNGIVILCRF